MVKGRCKIDGRSCDSDSYRKECESWQSFCGCGQWQLDEKKSIEVKCNVYINLCWPTKPSWIYLEDGLSIDDYTKHVSATDPIPDYVRFAGKSKVDAKRLTENDVTNSVRMLKGKAYWETEIKLK